MHRVSFASRVCHRVECLMKRPSISGVASKGRAPFFSALFQSSAFVAPCKLLPTADHNLLHSFIWSGATRGAHKLLITHVLIEAKLAAQSHSDKRRTTRRDCRLISSRVSRTFASEHKSICEPLPSISQKLKPRLSHVNTQLNFFVRVSSYPITTQSALSVSIESRRAWAAFARVHHHHDRGSNQAIDCSARMQFKMHIAR